MARQTPDEAAYEYGVVKIDQRITVRWAMGFRTRLQADAFVRWLGENAYTNHGVTDFTARGDGYCVGWSEYRRE